MTQHKEMTQQERVRLLVQGTNICYELSSHYFSRGVDELANYYSKQADWFLVELQKEIPEKDKQ